jgi:hypothetical protein
MRMRKADSTIRSSRAVPHPSTNRALRRLTSEVRRDPVHSTRYGRQRNCSRASSAPTRLSRIADSQGAFRLASRAEKLKRPAKLWLWAPRRAVRGALTHEAFFDLPSLSPPCKQSRESFTIAGGSGDWQTLALVFKHYSNNKFLFCSSSDWLSKVWLQVSP